MKKKVGSVYLTRLERSGTEGKYRLGMVILFSKEELEKFLSSGSCSISPTNITPLEGGIYCGNNKRKEVTSRVRVRARNTSFEEFWTLYPRKTGKRACQKIWQKLAGKNELPSTKKIVTALKKQIEEYDWNEKIKDKKERSFIPHPSTWLNQGRWDDEVDTESEEMKPRARVNIGCQSRRR